MITKDEIRKLNDSFDTIKECYDRIEEAQQYINSLKCGRGCPDLLGRGGTPTPLLSKIKQ